MGDDWQPGDLALCVRKRLRGVWPAKRGHRLPRVGGVYQVEAVLLNKSVPGLVLVGHHSDHPDGPAWSSIRFVKVSPGEPDEEDRETIRLLNSAPANVPARAGKVAG